MSDPESAGIEPVQRSDPVQSAREFLLGVPAWLDNWHMSHQRRFCSASNARPRPAFGEPEPLAEWERELLQAVAVEAGNVQRSTLRNTGVW